MEGRRLSNLAALNNYKRAKQENAIFTKEAALGQLVRLCDAKEPHQEIAYSVLINEYIMKIKEFMAEESFVNDFQKKLIECISNLPNKTSIYTAFVYYLYTSYPDFVQNLYSTLLTTLSQYWNQIEKKELQFRLIIRFFGLSVQYHLLSEDTLLNLYTHLLSILQLDIRSIYKELLLYSILSSFLFCGSVLSSSFFDSIASLLKGYLETRTDFSIRNYQIFPNTTNYNIVTKLLRVLYPSDGNRVNLSNNNYIQSEVYRSLSLSTPDEALLDINTEILLEAPSYPYDDVLSSFLFFPSLPKPSHHLSSASTAPSNDTTISSLEWITLEQMSTDLNNAFFPAYKFFSRTCLFLYPSIDHLYYMLEPLFIRMLMPLPFPTEGSNPSLYDARQTFPLVYYANCICNFILYTITNKPVGQLIHSLFDNTPEMNPVSLSKFAQFFAIYLSNTSFNWPWNRWTHYLQSDAVYSSFLTSVCRQLNYVCEKSKIQEHLPQEVASLYKELRSGMTALGEELLPLYEQLYKRVPVMNLKTLYPPMEDAKEIIRAFLNEKESSSSISDLVRVLLYTYVELYSQNIRVEVLNEIFFPSCSELYNQSIQQDPIEPLYNAVTPVSAYNSFEQFFLAIVFEYYHNDYISLYILLNELLSSQLVSAADFLDYLYYHASLLFTYVFDYVLRASIDVRIGISLPLYSNTTSLTVYRYICAVTLIDENGSLFIQSFIQFVLSYLNSLSSIPSSFYDLFFEFYKQMFVFIDNEFNQSIMNSDLNEAVIQFYRSMNEF